MEAKEIMDIIDEADCNANTCFVASDKTLKPLGWAKHLIEVSFKAGVMEGYPNGFLDGSKVGRKGGIKEVIDWAEKDRKTLKLLKANQKLEKLTDYQTQVMLGAKMKTLQLLINKFKQGVIV